MVIFLAGVALVLIGRLVYLEAENAGLRDDLAKLMRAGRQLADSGELLADQLDNLLPLGNVDPVEPSNVHRLPKRRETPA